jgi:hypothetical protein
VRIVGQILSTLGGQGPALLVVSLCAGLLIPPLAHIGYDILPFSAFLLTLGSFLTAGLAPSEARIRPPLMVGVLVWVGVALPLAAATLISFLPLDPALRAGVLLSMLAPPVGSAAAIAAMLGLRPRLALLVSIALTVLTPISIPVFAAVLGLGIAFDMGALAIRLFGIIAAASLVAFLATEGYVAACVIIGSDDARREASWPICHARWQSRREGGSFGTFGFPAMELVSVLVLVSRDIPVAGSTDGRIGGVIR